ncbi:MAG: phosphodiesterase [Ruminococcaceae bacterium]|nr:phosphodiesterase [Oscillospiraceae bacterium]
MKLMIASDIHGSYFYCEKLLVALKKENADRLLLLGDLLYHGPRNDLPEGYAPKKVITALNSIKEIILAVRGNCDTEVDQMVLEFPILADYCIIQCGEKTVYATHGHKYGETTPPPMPKGSILLNGHTHIPKCTEYDTYTYMNPGSVSIPKENSHHGYMVYENNSFIWKDLDGNIIDRSEF